MARILTITDNPFLAAALQRMVGQKGLVDGNTWEWACSVGSLGSMSGLGLPFSELRLKADEGHDWASYDLILSAHCKQLFPAAMVQATRCVNIHPGLNPHNRGWFPQVFSILNGKPVGATIHAIDEQLDHGLIIAQKEVPVFAWDTSKDVYDRVQQAEVELLELHLEALVSGRYTTTSPSAEGNINLKKDFDQLLLLNLNEQLTMREAIDRLRALTHGTYRNAHFIDPATGRKVFVSINLEPEH